MNLNRYKKFVFLLLLFVQGYRQVSASTDPVSLFSDANKAYMDQKYDKAAELYEQIIKNDNVSFEVYFNLGNTYYKLGKIAPAILNYERAKRLRPSDPDVNYNLRIANNATIDKIEANPMVFYEKWWKNFVNGGSVHNRSITTLVLVWLGLVLAAGYLFLTNRTIRKILFFSSLASIIAGLFMYFLTSLQHTHLNSEKGAVIFTESIYIKSSPDEKSENLFMLHAGTRIDVIDQLHSWKKVRIANGNEGWVKAEALEII